MIKQLSSKEVYKNKWMTVREDQVEFPNGHRGIYGVVDKPPFALIIPYDGAKLYLVKQFRYPIQRDSWEFPEGTHEETADADPMELAASELEEEAGLKAGSLTKLGSFNVAVGFCTQLSHVYLAQNLTKTDQMLDATEAGMEVGSFSAEQFRQMLQDGEIVDAPTIAAFTMFNNWLNTIAATPQHQL